MNNPTRTKLIEAFQNESKHAHADMRYHEGRMSAFLVAEEIVRNVWDEIEKGNRPCTCDCDCGEVTKDNLRDREVTKDDLRDREVTKDNLRDREVTKDNLRDREVTKDDLCDPKVGA